MCVYVLVRCVCVLWDQVCARVCVYVCVYVSDARHTNTRHWIPGGVSDVCTQLCTCISYMLCVGGCVYE